MRRVGDAVPHGYLLGLRAESSADLPLNAITKSSLKIRIKVKSEESRKNFQNVKNKSPMANFP